MAESESSLSTIGTWIGKCWGLQIGELAIGALPPCQWRTFACGCCSKLLTCGRQQVQIHIHKYTYKYVSKYKYKFAYGCCSKLPMCGQEQVQKQIHTPNYKYKYKYKYIQVVHGCCSKLLLLTFKCKYIQKIQMCTCSIFKVLIVILLSYYKRSPNDSNVMKLWDLLHTTI